jgi:hypothetical protein
MTGTRPAKIDQNLSNDVQDKTADNLERRNTRSLGKPLIGHPPGQHDDLACAFATAAVACQTKQPMQITEEAVRAMESLNFEGERQR